MALPLTLLGSTACRPNRAEPPGQAQPQPPSLQPVGERPLALPSPTAAPAPTPTIGGALPDANADAAVQLASAGVVTGGFTPSQQSRRTPVVDAVQQAAPAVVSVMTEQRPQNNPFGFFGLDDEEGSGGGRTSLGSGVIVDPHGLVVTNEHVVAGAARIRVQLADGRELPATLVGADQSFDLAVLRLDNPGRELPALRLGTANDLMIGETVIAIGNPFGLSHTVTSGVISAVHRVVRTKNRTYEDFIQTDAQINPGNSGGPLLNIHAELIGINTAVHSGGPGIGFAIPIDRAKTIVNDLLQFGRVRYGWIGIRAASLQQRRRVPGVVVAEVESGSPAAQAGLQPGDVVAAVNDEPVTSVDSYWDRMQHVLSGDEVRLRLLRGEVKLRAGTLDPKEVAARAQRRLGLEIADAGGRAVLVRRVTAGGVGDRIGFQPGDAILQIGARSIKKTGDFQSALGEIRPGSDTVMLVVRGQYSYYVTVPL